MRTVFRLLRTICSKNPHFCARYSPLHTSSPQGLENASQHREISRLPVLALDFSRLYQSSILIFTTMNDLLYVIAVILIIGWLLGAFVFSVGSIIHLLLVVAIIAVLLRLIRGRSV
jgi:hypothetical protein